MGCGDSEDGHRIKRDPAGGTLLPLLPVSTQRRMQMGLIAMRNFHVQVERS